MLTPEDHTELQRLAREHIPLRAIARRLNRDPKTIRRALGRSPQPSPPAAPPPSSKLAPYHELIRQRSRQGLRGPRILREIQERGYPGGRTILKDFLQRLAPQPPKAPRVFHRFETRPGQEAQSDWSPYRVMIAGRLTIVHAFALILCFCRRLFVAFFRDERLPTLLWAHPQAFHYHRGLCHRVAYDNQTAITLGRVGGTPRWHPTFLTFARHYGFQPLVGRPGHKERRGKVERPFHYLEHDFLAGRSFASWDDLNQQCRQWLDAVANVRLHGTTRRYVHAAFAEEAPCLIALPAVSFPAARQETRSVQKDGYIPVGGSYYPVPAHLVDAGEGTVSVRIDPEHVQILDAAGEVAVTHPVPETPTRIPAPAPPPGPYRVTPSRPALEAAFLARFPDAQPFLDGLRQRMATLTPIHLRALQRLVSLYGDDAVHQALERASAYRNWSAYAVERILQRAHPSVVPEPAPGSLSARPEAFGALDDIDSGSPSDYTLDSMPPTGDHDHDA